MPGSRVRTQRSTAPTLLPNLDEHGAPHLRLSDLLLTTLTVQPCAPCGEHGGAAQGRTQRLEANLSRRGWQFSRFSRPSLDQFNLIHPLPPPIHHTPLRRAGSTGNGSTARRRRAPPRRVLRHRRRGRRAAVRRLELGRRGCHPSSSPSAFAHAISRCSKCLRRRVAAPRHTTWDCQLKKGGPLRIPNPDVGGVGWVFGGYFG